MTTATNSQLNRRKCQSGMDGLEFALVLDDLIDVSFDEAPLLNKATPPKSMVLIKCTNGRFSGSVNLFGDLFNGFDAIASCNKR